MKQCQTKELKQLFQNSNVAEVMLSYKTKTKAADRPKITSSQNVFELLKTIWPDDTIEYREEFKLVLLNRANQVLGLVNISQGGVSGTVCDPKLVLQAALLANASSIIIAHNHPSSQTSPSKADRDLTNKINSACKFMDLSLCDHLIVTRDTYYSFADNGEL